MSIKFQVSISTSSNRMKVVCVETLGEVITYRLYKSYTVKSTRTVLLVLNVNSVILCFLFDVWGLTCVFHVIVGLITYV